LDNKFRQCQKILNIELVSIGSIKETIVEPMEVLSVPLQKRAVKIILVHNHPSQQLIPSDTDKDITDRLIQCGLIMHVPVIDHMIITEKSFYSFEASGLLKELEASTKYVPNFILKQRWEKQMKEELAKSQKAKDKIEKQLKAEMAKTKAEIAKTKRTKENMAKTMKAKGYAIDEIVELTGLTKQTIQRFKK